MKIISHFVRVDADGVAFYGINGEVEKIAVDMAELVIKEFAVAGLPEFPERLRAANLVFPKTALRFMHGHADGV